MEKEIIRKITRYYQKYSEQGKEPIFDLKQTKNQDHYLTITESKRRFDEAKGTFYYENIRFSCTYKIF